MPYTSRQWVVTKRLKGAPCDEDFIEQEEDMPDLRKDEILCRAVFISIDPIISLHLSYADPGEMIPGRQVARIVESRNPDWSKGKLIMASLGWSTYNVVDPSLTQELGGTNVPVVENLPKQCDQGKLSKCSSLGILGIPGLTAYLGLTEVGKPKAGETIVVSSGAGQMGHLVGQIAKLLGLRVLGYAGTGEKASWIKTDLGFDWAFNYKTQDIHQTLNIAAPNGVDIFWDGVGGSFSATVLSHMSMFGRVIMVGNLSSYGNPKSCASMPGLDLAITLKELTVVGFNVYRYHHLWEAARETLVDWVKDDKIQLYEHTVEGFELIPRAFIDQMEGVSQGKVIVRC